MITSKTYCCRFEGFASRKKGLSFHDFVKKAAGRSGTANVQER
jgi:hypothetical protein